MYHREWVDRLFGGLKSSGTWVLAVLWIVPLAYIFWAGFRNPQVALSLDITSGWTFDNLLYVWNAAPFGRYYFNTILLVIGLSTTQIVLGSLAAYGFARYTFPGREVLFLFVLLQLMIFPEILLLENFRLVSSLGLYNTIPGIGIVYAASAFAIFLIRQAFRSVPEELVEAAEIEGASRLAILWKVYVPVARPSIAAFAIMSISSHWNNFLWPLIITRSPEARPVTVGIARYLSPDTGIDIGSLSAGTVIVVGPLLIIFLIFQRKFIRSFTRSEIL
jgi:sn-glycerol 3-phosphate transport system permease protein